MILKDGLSIRGLNTAATLWCTAAIGSLSGLGYIFVWLVGTFGILGANILLRPIAKAMDRNRDTTDAEILYLVRIVCRTSDENRMRALLLESVSSQPLPVAFFAERGR